MTLKQIVATISALGVILGAAFTIDTRYLHAAEAEKQQAAAEQKQAKSVSELRVELYLSRVKAINDKAKPSKDELDEKERLLALVRAIEAEQKAAK